jgi:hypothetical protein
MLWRRSILGIAAAFLVGISLLSGSGQTPSAQAAALAAPHLISKQILGETSIDGPALAKTVIGAEGERTMVLAWTGTDPAHRLNVMTSRDGATWFNKRILRETSFVRPAVDRRPEMAGNEVVLAWTGNDARHTLNILWNADGHGSSPMKKVTFWGETSFTAPAIALSGDRIYLAWVGTDPNHSLNVMTLSVAPEPLKVISIKRYLPFTSNARPSIAFGPSGTVLLAWTTTAGQVSFAVGDTALRFGAAKVSTNTSFAGPDFFSRYDNPNILKDTTTPKYWWAWTGKDAHRSIHIAFNNTAAWPPAGNAATLGEWALGGPVMAWRGVTNRMMLAWTGTDPAHHLNIGVVSVG